MPERKIISVLGASGSVGLQALDIARMRGYKVDFISVNRDIAAAEDIVREFSPALVACADIDKARDLKDKIADTDTKVLFGKEGIIEGIGLSKSETVINSIIGEAGLMPTLAVIDSGKRLALANKESLVIAGEEVMKRAKDSGSEILPVDSEHSAIFQSLKAGNPREIKKIILTASGGPFYGKSPEELRSVTLEDTLAHPTWKMGRKITVDSATLMNKGYEIMEAAHLFGVFADRIEVVVHRQSILHSAVEYIDNTVIGEFSLPDMRMCVQYAVDYPERHETAIEELDLVKLSKMTFEAPDYNAFPLLALAKDAMRLGGAMGAIINASDEVAVESFLTRGISFVGVMQVVEETFERFKGAGSGQKSLSEILEFSALAREYAGKIIKEKKY